MRHLPQGEVRKALDEGRARLPCARIPPLVVRQPVAGGDPEASRRGLVLDLDEEPVRGLTLAGIAGSGRESHLIWIRYRDSPGLLPEKLVHVAVAEDLAGGRLVVRSTAQRNALHRMAAAAGPGLEMVELDEIPTRAAPPAPRHEAAATPVSLPDRALNRVRDVTGRARAGAGRRLLGRSLDLTLGAALDSSLAGKLCELALARLDQELRRRAFQDLGEVPIGNLVPEQRA